MIYTEEIINPRLNIIVQNDFDWLELFEMLDMDSEISITLNWENMDFFFPNWRTEAGPENLSETLNELQANRFGAIKVTIADGVMNKDGEGVYEVESFAIAYPVEDDQDKIDIPLGTKALAKLFYKVTLVLDYM